MFKWDFVETNHQVEAMESLLFWWNVQLVMDFRFDVVDCVSAVVWYCMGWSAMVDEKRR